MNNISQTHGPNCQLRKKQCPCHEKDTNSDFIMSSYFNNLHSLDLGIPDKRFKTEYVNTSAQKYLVACMIGS